MEQSSDSRMSFREAVAGKWQIPLFLLSVVLFVFVLFQARPDEPDPIGFDEMYLRVEILSEESRFSEFYLAEMRPHALERDEKQYPLL